MADRKPDLPSIDVSTPRSGALLTQATLSPPPVNVGFSVTPQMALEHERQTMPRAPPALFRCPVTKLRSWRTGYPRILVLYKDSMATLHPDTLQVTNQWNYNSLSEWRFDKQTLRLHFGTDELHLGCHVPSIVLSHILECRSGRQLIRQMPVMTDGDTPARFEWYAAACCLASAARSQTVAYTDVRALALSGPNGVVLHRYEGPSWEFTPQGPRTQWIASMQQACASVGVEVVMDSTSAHRKIPGRSQARWMVTRLEERRQFGWTDDGYWVEWDLHGEAIEWGSLDQISALIRIDSAILVVELTTGTSLSYQSTSRDQLLVSLLNVVPDSLLLDHSTAGFSLVQRLTPIQRSILWVDRQPVFDVFSHCLHQIYSVATQAYAYITDKSNGAVVEECTAVVEACKSFNASVLPGDEGDDRCLPGVIGALWGLVVELLKTSPHMPETDQVAGTLFQSLCRLSMTEAGYRCTAELTTFQEAIPLVWIIEDSFAKYWFLRTFNTLLSAFPVRDLETEYVNKSVVLKIGGTTFLEGVIESLVDGASVMVLLETSDILQSLLCSNYDTTPARDFSALIGQLSGHHWSLLALLRSESPSVVENAALVLHMLSSHAPNTATAIRASALASGVFLEHFYAAVFHVDENQRFLSRFLCSVWLSGPPRCEEKRLLQRMVPQGFLPFLAMPELSVAEEEQLDALERETYGDGAVRYVRSRLKQRIDVVGGKVGVLKENFRIFFHVLTQDHTLPDLIWSQQTRQELKIALDTELRYLRRSFDTLGTDRVAWNHQQFTVEYPSLASEVKVGSVYMRLWLEAGEGFIRNWDDPVRLFELLFRKFLCEMDRDRTISVMCIRCIERLYSAHASAIGPFTDVMVFVHCMASTEDRETQHRLLRLLATIVGLCHSHEANTATVVPENAEQLVNSTCIGLLCQFVAFAHSSNISQATALDRELAGHEGTTALLTQDPDSRTGGIPNDSHYPAVWYVSSSTRVPPPDDVVKGPYRLSDLHEMYSRGDLGPFDLVSSVHVDEYGDARSDDVVRDRPDTGDWKRLKEVWQLRWWLLSDNVENGLYSPAEIASLAAEVLHRLVGLHSSVDFRGIPFVPIPAAKRLLTGIDANSMDRHIIGARPIQILVQALLSNNSLVVDRIAALLQLLLKHNDAAVSKLYLTGIFYFALMYTGSNFYQIAKLLQETHMHQKIGRGASGASVDADATIKDRSVLGDLIPEGLIHVLENYGAERFAETFVSVADTPEVVWTPSMRRHLVDMIRQHLGDFPSRLHQNNTVEYDFCPIPPVTYEELRGEVFCDNYYLQNLCDEVRFPEWPVVRPVELFTSCLRAFRAFADHLSSQCGPSEIANAVQILELRDGDGSKELRRAYRILARKYHPDKVR